VRELGDLGGGNAGQQFGSLQRVGVDARAERFEPTGRALDEGAILQAGGEDLARDAIGECDIRTDVEAEPAIGPLRGAGLTGIDDVQLRAVVNAL